MTRSYCARATGPFHVASLMPYHGGLVNGIVIDLDPVAVHVGMFAIRWFAIFTIIAAGAAWWLGLREARRKGLPIEKVGGSERIADLIRALD